MKTWLWPKARLLKLFF